jgi:hypothetical protein
MEYVIINTDDNSWQFESDDLCEAEVQFLDIKALGINCVLVQVLCSTDEELK